MHSLKPEMSSSPLDALAVLHSALPSGKFCSCAGIVRRKWIWVALFAPLWGVLFVSFGLGPIVTRTSDRLPLLYNTAAFLAAALVFRLSPLFQQGAIDTSVLKKGADGQDNNQ